MFWKKKGRKSKEPEGVVADCGHLTLPEGEVAACNDVTIMTMPENDEGGFDYCLDCIAKMTIRCAWCGSAIFIGSPITLYTPMEEVEIPEYAVKYSDNPPRFVGCLLWDCAYTGADRAGFWLPGSDGKGYVKRLPTAFETILGDPHINIVMVRDLFDPDERPYVE